MVDTCLRVFEDAAPLGSYFKCEAQTLPRVLTQLRRRAHPREGEAKTQQLCGQLWDKFDARTYRREAYQIIVERFRDSGLELTTLASRIVLDLGCGSGRYALAIAQVGAARVTAIDRGERSVRTAARIAAQARISNVEFHVGDVLQLPYRSHAFDFVFCNGVLHHTEDMERGIRELHRVLRPGGEAFLYVYADGGLFWYSRKQMRRVMKKIPQEYTIATLDLLGMPANRFFFVDNWYVPIERHSTRRWLEEYLAQAGFASIRKLVSGRMTDLDSAAAVQHPEARALWGDGEHRYLLTKAR